MTTASNFEQTLRRLWGRKAYGKCQFIDELGKRCDGTAINSHTVQKSRALSSISERGHVYHITTPKRPAASGTRIFESIGIKKASIFPGFCGAHDKTLFSPIEDEIGRLNMSDLALLAYRCICQETFKKERAEAVYSHPDLLQAALNEGERVNAAISVFLGGTRRGLADLRKQKERIEKIVNTQEHDNCFAHIFEFSEELPLAFSAVFAPEFSFGEMRILPFGNDDWNSVAAFCGSIKGSNVFGFFGVHENAKHNLNLFFESLKDVPNRKAGALALHTAIEYAENAFYRPSWINAILPETKQQILHRFADGMPGDLNRRKATLASQFDVVRMEATGRMHLV